MRIDKYLADMGAGTRSEIKKKIRKDGVRIGDARIHDPGFLVPEENADCPEIEFQGELWSYEPVVWYMMNKPAGVLSASEDRHQKTVVDLITERKRTDLFPVGRLDKDTEGLLLITNDGEMAHRLLAPKFHVDKTYLVRLSDTECHFTGEDVRRFAEGIRYDENLTALPARLEPLMTPESLETSITLENSGTEYSCEARVTIREGKFHQIKKMVAALGDGKEVGYLRRLSFGPLALDESLAPGKYRRLTETEIQLLHEAAGEVYGRA